MATLKRPRPWGQVQNPPLFLFVSVFSNYFFTRNVLYTIIKTYYMNSTSSSLSKIKKK